MTAPTPRSVDAARAALHMTIDVPCPKCGAAVGKPCVTPSGVVRFDYPHSERAKVRVRTFGR